MKKTHFIKQWRKHRGLTQERLADRLTIKQAHLSLIENYKRDYNQAVLEEIAYALMCEPADLIVRDPSNNNEIWTIWDKIPETERKKAIQVLKAFAGDITGTN